VSTTSSVDASGGELASITGVVVGLVSGATPRSEALASSPTPTRPVPLHATSARIAPVIVVRIDDR
jgi:hypothetical protein